MWPPPTPPAKTGKQRAAAILELAKKHGLRETQVSTELGYGDTVAAAGQAAGWARSQAFALWREAAAFAHGRTWPLLRLTTPADAELIRGGVGLYLTLDEARLEPLARLTADVLHKAIDEYARLSADVSD